VVAGLVLTLAVAAPAHAARWDGVDAASDAPLSVDISSVTVWNGPMNLTTRLRFFDLERRRLGSVSVTIDTGERFDEGYGATIRWRRGPGRFVRSFWRLPELGDSVSERVPCRGIGLDWQVGPQHRVEWVQVTVPQRCLGSDAGSVHLSAGAGVRTRFGGGDIVPELGGRQYRQQVIPRG
jgi:hypothetical protein